jgi:general secretion pathway protein J
VAEADMIRQRGFTLIELVLAMLLLGVMLALLYSGLSFAVRGWDAGDANGARVSDRRIAENFVRREIGEMFPMRWKDPMALKFAFEGEEQRLRFVSSRPAGISMGGLALVGIEAEPAAEGRGRDLVMRRAMPDDEAKDFGPLERTEQRSVLVPNIDSVSFSYFGSETDFADPKWTDAWTYTHRMPNLVRMRVRVADGSYLPDLVARVSLGEEAGCLENAFQRVCRPRRPT